MIFSVIIPVFNVENYIRECIDSVLKQSFCEYEIILIDDYSTDSSGRICDEYADVYGSIKVIHHTQNQGRLRSRIDGLTHSTGDYCFFLDSDDCWAPNLLEKCYDIIQKNAPDMICFRFSEKKDLSLPAGVRISAGYYHENNIDILKRIFLKGDGNNICLKCCKKNILQNWMSLTEYGQLNYGEDWLLVLDALNYTNNCVVTDDILYWYRRNAASATMLYREDNLNDLRVVWHNVIDRASKWGSNYLESAYFGVYANAFGFIIRTMMCLNSDIQIIKEFKRLRDVLLKLNLCRPPIYGLKQRYWIFTIDFLIQGRIKFIVNLSKLYVAIKKIVQ